jgi:hypothetical protein
MNYESIAQGAEYETRMQLITDKLIASIGVEKIKEMNHRDNIIQPDAISWEVPYQSNSLDIL